jgi:hypothetical protein
MLVLQVASMGLIVPELSHRLRASFGDNIRHFSDENGLHNGTAVPRRIFPLLTAQRQSNLLRQVEVLQENRSCDYSLRGARLCFP